MRIPCPFCGDRDSAEFAYLGDATLTRPRATENGSHDQTLFADYVYLRDNPPGWHREYWQHAGGCRSWLVVERHVTTHEITRASAARSTPVPSGSPAR